jgi:hypothetical protein
MVNHPVGCGKTRLDRQEISFTSFGRHASCAPFSRPLSQVRQIAGIFMPHWFIKSGIQRVISWLPNSAWWNAIFQQYVTRSIVLTPKQFADKLLEGRKYYELFRQHAPATRPDFKVVEIGTGWYPTIPLVFYLYGAVEIHTYDIAPLLHRDRLKTLLDLVVTFAADGRLAKQLPGLQEDRLKHLLALRPHADQQSPEAWLKRLNIHAAAQDARQTGLKSQDTDVIFSSGVLEYIPVPILREMLQEFRRIATPNAVMMHRLNLVDQFAYFDRSLSPFHHLKYTEKQWSWRSSTLIWQNRIRISDYRKLFAEAGFIVKSEENTSGTLAELQRVKLAPQFQNYTTEDLLILHSVMTAVPDCKSPAPAQS